jgi:urea transport system ATP-binding protein
MRIGHQPKDFLLAVEALTVSFDGFKAVNNLSFYVEENEIRVIIGPNGAGKTTVLDLICGKTKATSGSIQFRAGARCSARSPFSVMPQSANASKRSPR